MRQRHVNIWLASYKVANANVKSILSNKFLMSHMFSGFFPVLSYFNVMAPLKISEENGW